jgi:hypothetical protein
MDIVIIEIDHGKDSCSLTGLDALGRVVLRRRMRRSSLESFAKGLGRCMIAMEACCGAPHLGRVFAAQGQGSPNVAGICATLCKVGSHADSVEPHDSDGVTCTGALRRGSNELVTAGRNRSHTARRRVEIHGRTNCERDNRCLRQLPHATEHDFHGNVCSAS